MKMIGWGGGKLKKIKYLNISQSKFKYFCTKMLSIYTILIALCCSTVIRHQRNWLIENRFPQSQTKTTGLIRRCVGEGGVGGGCGGWVGDVVGG